MSSKPRVRIESDGTPNGTKVTVDGEPLNNVTSVWWHVDVHGLAIAHLTLVGDDVECDVVGDGTMGHQFATGGLAER